MTDPTSAYPEYEPYPPQPAVAQLPGLPPQVVEQPPVQPAPAPKPKKTGLVIVSIVAVLFLAAAATFGGLYFNEKSHSRELADTSSAQARELTKAGDDAKKLKADLATAEDARRKAEEAQKKAEGAVGNATKCQEAARTLRETAIAGDFDKLNRAVAEVLATC
ncbi:hypothetical protein Lesp02_16870 [Lentzea sp. NBRC 105346]|uniref:hypothetical protein n=1 Tax=Lentzea sp. NBRC 105346 TaxID=3032205 RepID=UPI0024A458AD|nr:hypothetical protein [Lentzea sp. NBRC 105346]GLZ29497.1 hypothetical protein Lesp02_16870 [Lentzea sp. NBRC 105346]